MKSHGWISISEALITDSEGYALKVMEVARRNILDIAVPRPMTETNVFFKGCDVVMTGRTPTFPGAGVRYSIFAEAAKNQLVGDERFFQNFAEIRSRIKGLAGTLTWHARTKLQEGKWVASGSKGSPHVRREPLGPEIWTYFDIENVEAAIAYCAATGERIFNLSVRFLLPVRHTNTAEANTRRWLEGHMRGCLQQRPFGMTKEKLRLEAEKKFGVGKRAYARAWKQAIKATGAKWDKPGAPSKLLQNNPHT